MNIAQGQRPRTSTRVSARLVEAASNHVLDLFDQSLHPKYVFHNQRFTILTVNAVRLIGPKEEIDKYELALAELCAWFHITGFIKTEDNYRRESALLARSFLEQHEVDDQSIEEVTNCILQSSSTWDVASELDMILYDAHWYFLAASNFEEMLDRKKEEIRLCQGEISPARWADFIYECFDRHQYLTEFGQTTLHKSRKKNFERLLRNSGKKSFFRPRFEPRIQGQN